MLCGLLAVPAFGADAGPEPGGVSARPGGSISVDELRRFTQVLAAIRARHVEPVDDRKLIEGAIRGLFAGLDAQSAYLDAAELKELQAADRTAGIGLTLRSADGLLTVLAPHESGPADRAGVRAGDVVLAIDGWTTYGATTTQAARRLGGPAGSTVELTLNRPPATTPLVLQLQRERLQPAAVRAEFAGPRHAYLKLPNLRADTAINLANQLRELYRGGQPAGLVIDLRNNTGGLFDAAVAVAAAFLPAGATVAQLDSRRDGPRTLKAVPADYAAAGRDPLAGLPEALKTVPLVALVNGQSAAGAEIIAGALQDHRRAILIGEPTFGLAAIQTLLPLPQGGAIKLTTGRWRTPNGRSVAGTGLSPDLAGNPPSASETARDPLLHQALRTLDAAAPMKK